MKKNKRSMKKNLTSKRPFGLLIVIIVMVVGTIILASSVHSYEMCSTQMKLRLFAAIIMLVVDGVLIKFYLGWQNTNPPNNI